VAISSRTESELQDTASKMKMMMMMMKDSSSSLCSSSSIAVCVADVNDQSQVQSMVNSIVSQWGGIDILINNAGANQPTTGTFDTLDSEDLLRLLNLNVVAVHRVTSAVVPHMKESGKIINVSSRAGKIGIPNMAFYVTSKFALEGLTATMAEELKGRKIQVNSISPGMVHTKSFPKPHDRPGVRTAESIEDGLFVLLESDVTGHYLHVDELDRARKKGMEDNCALKPIGESPFDP
jgi:NAD(P)-dependent dehydrogenase (short-subunit alcohol dehydrogenase family)